MSARLGVKVDGESAPPEFGDGGTDDDRVLKLENDGRVISNRGFRLVDAGLLSPRKKLFAVLLGEISSGVRKGRLEPLSSFSDDG